MQNTPNNPISPNPLFSVLIANYNNGKYLMEAIDSVRRQTYTHWEIILVDDASTDNSKELYKELEKDNRIHIYYNEENRGCGYTKRRCADLANGELCGFLDPDDALTDDALSTMAMAHIREKDSSLIYSCYYIADAMLNCQGISQHQCSLPQGMSFLEYGNGAVSQFATFKKAKYAITNGINPHARRAVDHELYFLLEEVGSLTFVDKPLYYYRCNTGNNISLGGNAFKALLWDFLAAANACQRRGLSVETIAMPLIENYLNSFKSAVATESANSVRRTHAYQIGAMFIRIPKKLKSWLTHK